jgi:hypothetical protein
MSSMSAAALKQRILMKKLSKRPRKKTATTTENNLPSPLDKDLRTLSVSALPLLCQNKQQLSVFVLTANTETTQLLQKFLVLKESYPRSLLLILLTWWKWTLKFNLSLNFKSLKEFSNQNQIKDKEKFNSIKARTWEEVRMLNRTSKNTNESNINVDQTLLNIVKYMTTFPFNFWLQVLR